jgi:hypothetical protein
MRSTSAAISDAVVEATGRSHRDDPVVARSGGPAGNARLTAWTGIILLALSLAELVTLLDVQHFISWHVVIGVLLVPPALLKTGTTGWRIVRYYTGHTDYVRAGPPPLLLRLLGPAVVVFTLAVLASGLVLVVIGPQRSQASLVSAFGLNLNAITVHQAMFVGWAVATGLHVLGRVVPAVRLTLAPPPDSPSVPGHRRRVSALLAATVVAAVASPLVLGAAGSWQHFHHDRDHDQRGSQNHPVPQSR